MFVRIEIGFKKLPKTGVGGGGGAVWVTNCVHPNRCAFHRSLWVPGVGRDVYKWKKNGRMLPIVGAGRQEHAGHHLYSVYFICWDFENFKYFFPISFIPTGSLVGISSLWGLSGKRARPAALRCLWHHGTGAWCSNCERLGHGAEARVQTQPPTHPELCLCNLQPVDNLKQRCWLLRVPDPEPCQRGAHQMFGEWINEWVNRRVKPINYHWNRL